MEIDSVIANEIVRRLNETQKREHGRIVKDYLNILQCGQGTLYKILKKHGYDSGRKPRRDKGIRRIQITDDQLRMIAGAVKKSKRKKRRPTMPTTVAVEIAAQAGVIPDEMADKVSTINRLLRKAGISKDHQMRNWTTDDHTIPAFYTPLVSEHPNEWHLFDITPCTQYFFNTKGLRQRDENLQLYGGKLKYYKETNDHLLRYVLIDHKTDIFYLQYFYAAGENLTNFVEFLYRAWSHKEDSLYPFQGVPLNLYLDKGSANLSHYIQNMCRNLKVNLHSHKAGNPRAKGKVECYMKLIQEQFESRLSLKSATNLEELNQQAYAWMVHYCATKKHRRTQLCRTAFWASRITNEHLRTIKIKELFLKSVRSKSFAAVVTAAKTIYVDGKEYLIKGNVNPRDRVICDRDYYDPTALYAYRRNEDGTMGDPLSLVLIPKNELGESAFAIRLGKEFKRHEDTIATKEMKAMDKLDYTDMAAAAFADRRGELGKIAYIERQGTAIDLTAETQRVQRDEGRKTVDERRMTMDEGRGAMRRKDAETVTTITYSRHEVFGEIRHRLKLERILPLQSELIEKILDNYCSNNTPPAPSQEGRLSIPDAVIEEICREIFRKVQIVETVQTVQTAQAVTA